MASKVNIGEARDGQRGMFMIEALIGILIFSIGILALVAIQTRAVTAQSDAEYRIEAANLVNQMVNQIWLNVDRTSGATTLVPSLNAFQHQATGTNCSFSGTASANALVTAWVTAVTTGTKALPGTSTATQQILVNTAPGSMNSVTVTVCWKGPLDPVYHHYSVTTQVN